VPILSRNKVGPSLRLGTCSSKALPRVIDCARSFFQPLNGLIPFGLNDFIHLLLSIKLVAFLLTDTVRHFSSKLVLLLIHLVSHPTDLASYPGQSLLLRIVNAQHWEHVVCIFKFESLRRQIVEHGSYFDFLSFRNLLLSQLVNHVIFILRVFLIINSTYFLV